MPIPMVEAIPEKVFEAIIDSVPMRRMETPEEIANTVAWLAGEGDGYTIGANIPINGGLLTSN